MPRTREMSPPGSMITASRVRSHAAMYALAATGPTTARRTRSMCPGRLVRERRAAAARGTRVRVAELEPGALQPDDVVDGDALEVHRAHGIDVDLDPLLLEG